MNCTVAEAPGIAASVHSTILSYAVTWTGSPRRHSRIPSRSPRQLGPCLLRRHVHCVPVRPVGLALPVTLLVVVVGRLPRRACQSSCSGVCICASELDGADRTKPPTDFAWVFLIHVKEVRHHWLHHRFAFVIRRHRNRTAKYLQRAAVPVFDDMVQGGKAGIDEGT